MTIPLSVFPDVNWNKPTFEGVTSWIMWADRLHAYSEGRREGKADQWLFAPTIFTRSYRSKSTATHAGMIIVDVDGGDLDAVRGRLIEFGVAACVYTSASSQPDDHRFRVLIPLADLLDAVDYPSVWHSVVAALPIPLVLPPSRSGADATKSGAESLFYFPARYDCAREHVFEIFDGGILSGAEWREVSPAPQPKPEAAPVRIQYKLYPVDDPGDLFHSEFVTQEMIEDYLSTPKGGHHAALYRFMCRVASRAVYFGTDLDAPALAQYARDLDFHDGHYYDDRGRGRKTKRDFLREAVKALDWAHSHTTPINHKPGGNLA